MTGDDSAKAAKNRQGGPSEQGLIRLLARRLSAEGDGATSLRLALNSAISDDCTKKGGILTALRNSPLVGAESDIDSIRPRARSRKVEL
jgi:hypothetical protein